MKFSRQFWGGGLVGLSLGLMLGGYFVENTAPHQRWLVLISTLLAWAGVSLTLAKRKTSGS